MKTSSSPSMIKTFAFAPTEHFVKSSFRKNPGVLCIKLLCVVTRFIEAEERRCWRGANRTKLKRHSTYWSFYCQTSKRTAIREDSPVNYFRVKIIVVFKCYYIDSLTFVLDRSAPASENEQFRAWICCANSSNKFFLAKQIFFVMSD